jgi:MFS family permease
VTASTTPEHDSADDPAAASRPADPKRDPLDPALVRLALVLMLGALAAGLDSTIANVALDRIGRDFAVSATTVQRVITGYLLPMTMIVPLTGWATDRSFTASSILLFLLGGSVFGALFLLPLYYQQARGAGVLHAGLLLAPLGAGMSLAMTNTGKLIDRTGAERTITLAGMGLAVAGLIPYTLVGSTANQVVLAVGLFVAGLGIGAVTLTALTVTYRGLTPKQIAPATSANRIMQQLGSVFGTVVLALILQHAASTRSTPAAFGHTFIWALGLTALAIIPALALPPAQPQRHRRRNRRPGRCPLRRSPQRRHPRPARHHRPRPPPRRPRRTRRIHRGRLERLHPPRRRAAHPQAPRLIEEAPHHGRIAQDVKPRAGRARTDSPHDRREAATPVSPHPPPVLRLLTAPAQRPPRASQEREVQDDDGVGRPQPDIQRLIIRPQVTVQDPARPPDQVALTLSPPIRVRRDQPRLPP